MATPILARCISKELGPLYEVTFSDWTNAIADEDHLWQVQRADHRVYNKDKFFVKTTLELLGQPRRKAGPKAELLTAFPFLLVPTNDGSVN